MSNHNVSVHQLRSGSGKSYLNVDDDVLSQEGSVIVHTYNYEKFICLMQYDNWIFFGVFDSPEWAEEWMERHTPTKSNWIVTPIKPID